MGHRDAKRLAHAHTAAAGPAGPRPLPGLLALRVGTGEAGDVRTPRSPPRERGLHLGLRTGASGGFFLDVNVVDTSGRGAAPGPSWPESGLLASGAPVPSGREGGLSVSCPLLTATWDGLLGTTEFTSQHASQQRGRKSDEPELGVSAGSRPSALRGRAAPQTSLGGLGADRVPSDGPVSARGGRVVTGWPSRSAC